MRRGDNKPKVVSILPIAIYLKMELPDSPTCYRYHGGGTEPQPGLVEGDIPSRIGKTSIPFLVCNIKEKPAKAICIGFAPTAPSINDWDLDLKDFSLSGRLK